MARLAYGRPLQLKSGLLGLLLLLPACFTAGQMYQRVNPYNTTAGGLMMRGSYPAAQAPWVGTRWNSVHQLSNAIRAHESQTYGSGGAQLQSTQPQMARLPVQSAQPQMARLPVQSTQPQMARSPVLSSQPQMSSSQAFPGAIPNVSSQIASSQTVPRNGTAPYQTPMAQYEASNLVPRYPGVNSGVQPQYSQAFNQQVTPEAARQSSYASGTGPSASPGGTSNLYSSQYNNGAAANRFSGMRPNTNRPEANLRFPGSGRYTQSGRTTSSFAGIASGDPYTPYSYRGRQGNQPQTDQAASADSASSSAATTNEEPQSTDTEEGESSEVGSSGGIGVRRVMNPYDLSHIFPDIYQEQTPASYEDMTSQSLALLEMTTINSNSGTE